MQGTVIDDLLRSLPVLQFYEILGLLTAVDLAQALTITYSPVVQIIKGYT